MSRTTKQIAYGIFYALIWAGLIYSFNAVFLRPGPTCTDSLKNQEETEVDCGGPSCVSCAIKHLVPIEALPVRLLAGADAGHVTTLVELRNQNSTYGAQLFSYVLYLMTTSTTEAAYAEQIDVPMYPSEVKYRVTVNVPVPLAQITNAFIATSSAPLQWLAAENFRKPQLPTREIKAAISGDKILVTGFAKNDNPFALRRATVNVFFDGPDNTVISASKTILNDMLSSEERGFQVVVPLSESLKDKPLPQPRVVIDGDR